MKKQFEVLIHHAVIVMEWDNVETKSLRDKLYFIPRHKGRVTLAWRHPRLTRVSPDYASDNNNIQKRVNKLGAAGSFPGS